MTSCGPEPAGHPVELRLNVDRVQLASYMLSGKATPLYNAARELSDQTVGHAKDCEWHTNGHSYCSCPAYGAACAGVDAVLEELIKTGSPDDDA